MTEEEAEVEGVELEDGGDDDDDDVVGAWLEGPAPLRSRMGMLRLMISSPVSGRVCTSTSGSDSVSVSKRGGNLNFLVNVRNGVRRRDIIGFDDSDVSVVEYCRRRERG
jgi:hypothetical protein